MLLYSRLENNSNIDEEIARQSAVTAEFSKLHLSSLNLCACVQLSSLRLLYLMNADEGLVERDQLPSDCVVIYQGHHGDAGAAMADIILPGNFVNVLVAK